MKKLDKILEKGAKPPRSEYIIVAKATVELVDAVQHFHGGDLHRGAEKAERSLDALQKVLKI